MTDEEVSNKLTEHEQRIKVCEHRETDLENQNNKIQQLAMSVHDLAGSVSDMAKVQKCQGDRIEAIENAPMHIWSRILWIVITAAAGIAIGYITALF